MADRWFYLGSQVSSTNKTDCHDITEILLKVVLNTIHLTQNPSYLFFKLSFYVHVKLHIEHISRFSRKSYMWVGRHLILTTFDNNIHVSFFLKLYGWWVLEKSASPPPHTFFFWNSGALTWFHDDQLSCVLIPSLYPV